MNRRGRRGRRDFLIISALSAVIIQSALAERAVRIGSKKFTESYVLGEIAKRTLSDAGISAEPCAVSGGAVPDTVGTLPDLSHEESAGVL
jgi:glycine betaine/choline ABC-type transport system substrate-binding protein